MSGIYLIARCAHPLCARGQFHSKNTKSPHPHPHPGGEGASPKAERSNGPPGFAPNPVGLGRGAQVSADQGWHMSERSELCQTPLTPSTAGCPKRSAGTQTSGRLLLLTFLGEARKVSAQPGALPGLRPQQRATHSNQADPTRSKPHGPPYNQGTSNSLSPSSRIDTSRPHRTGPTA